MLALQSDVARGIAGSLALTLLPAEESRLAHTRPVQPAAYEARIKGLQHFYRLTPPDLDTAEQYFQLALRLDPGYAAGHAGIAAVWSGRQQMGMVPSSQATPKVMEAAAKAIELDDSIPEAHYAIGLARFYQWQWRECERELRRAIDLNPNYGDARAVYSHVLNILKRPAEAREQIDRALDVDPYNAFLHGFSGVDRVFERRWDDAVVELRKALSMSPGLPFAAQSLIGALHRGHRFSEALDALNAYAEIRAYSDVTDVLRRHRSTDPYPQLMRRAADVLGARAGGDFVSAYDVVTLYTFAGERDLALEWLEKAIDVRDPSTPFVVSEPDFESLWSHPRFGAVTRPLGLPN
jgi:tetratricopeptide (TPR) repeat protein